LEPEDLAYCHLQDHYAARVKRMDAVLSCVVQEFERRGLLDDMVVLFTSDHGLRLGEETTRPGSRLLLHEELIHIPLLLRLPEKAQAGRRVAALTQSIDILPTLFDLFALPLPAAHGYRLLPLANGKTDRVRPYACAGLCTSDGTEWALRSPDWAFLLPVSRSASDFPIEAELYVKPEDRWEVNNVRQHHLEFAERLEQTLQSFVAATRRPGPLQDLRPSTFATARTLDNWASRPYSIS
jgi:arylsulfatase A-like enzyme